MTDKNEASLSIGENVGMNIAALAVAHIFLAPTSSTWRTWKGNYQLIYEICWIYCWVYLLFEPNWQPS